MNKYLICFFIVPVQASISIVYNLRVAETSKRLEIGSSTSYPSSGTCTLFGTFREKYNGVKHSNVSGLFSLIYAPKSFFVSMDMAVGQVFSDTNGVHFSRTQTDDLLFSAGYSPPISEKVRITFSGLLGFPTHDDTSLEYVQLGYGHYGIGMQVDGTIAYLNNVDHTLRYAARYIYFFPREVPAIVDAPNMQFHYALGNLADLFFAFHSTIARHSIEVGYNPSFFFGARIFPPVDDALKKTDYIRNSFYGIYKYNFLICGMEHTVTAALSYGFEPTPKVFGNKHIISAWAAWSINS
jgi:hypothetical protein